MNTRTAMSVADVAARVVTLAQRLGTRGYDATGIRELATHALTDLQHACGELDIYTDNDMPPLARAAFALAHALIGFCDAREEARPMWALGIADLVQVIRAENRLSALTSEASGQRGPVTSRAG